MTFRHWLAAVALTAAPLIAAAQDRVVYHIDDAQTQALKGLRNIKNHLDVDQAARITVVTHANGVDFLMTDAKYRNGNPYEISVQELVRRGVAFEICDITLRNRSLKRDQFIAEAGFTPSGVVRLAKLQKEGAAYIKP